MPVGVGGTAGIVSRAWVSSETWMATTGTEGVAALAVWITPVTGPIGAERRIDTSIRIVILFFTNHLRNIYNLLFILKLHSETQSGMVFWINEIINDSFWSIW